MKITLEWLHDYVSPVAEAQAVADTLMNAGLPVETIEAVAGRNGPTQMLDVEVTSNRTDCLSLVGVAREYAALTGGKFAEPAIQVNESATPVSGVTSVQIGPDARDLCPFYSARIIRNVKVGPSPAWLRTRVESIGLRSINNIVDVTNYVLFELGQPLHAFDFDKLTEKRIVVRRATAGEKIVAIDGRTYELNPSQLVIADAIKPQAIAGVMGGKDTEVIEATTTVLLESARFEQLNVRTTSRALGLKSDSSYRFERGIDPTLADKASRRAAQLILDVAGGELLSGAAVAGAVSARAIAITLRLARIEQILGYTIPPERALAILTALGFSPVRAGEVVNCTVPSHRLDVEREIDLIEEIARVHGYQHLPVHDRVSHTVRPQAIHEKANTIVRDVLVAAGYNEAITVTFQPRAETEAFLPKEMGEAIKPAHGGWAGDVLRASVMPSLLQVRRTNQNAGIADACLFEIAETYWQKGDAKTNPPTQMRVLAIVGNSIHELRGALEAVCERINPRLKLIVEPCKLSWYVPGASASIALELDGKRAFIGCVGQISAALQKHYDLREKVYALEVELPPVLEVFEPVRRASPLPKFPGVTRDLSVVVDESVRWADVQAKLSAAQLAFCEKIDFVTTFRGKGVGDGKKSLTLTLSFRDPARTLKSEEVDTQVKTAVDTLASAFAATLRV